MNTANFPWLTTIILFPIAAALLIPFFPDEGDKAEQEKTAKKLNGMLLQSG